MTATKETPTRPGKAETELCAEVARLSDRLRVTAEIGADPRQWMLQKQFTEYGTHIWKSISWCQTSDGLLLMIREKCFSEHMPVKERHAYPGLDAAAIATIKALPDRFPRKA